MTSSAGTSALAVEPAAPCSAQLAALGAALGELQTTALALEPVLVEKQRALVANRLELIELLVQRESELSTRLSAQEFQRQLCVMDLAERLGVPSADIRLADLRAAASHPGLSSADRETLLATESQAAELVDQLRRLDALNADNAFLSNNLLEYTQFVLQLVHNGTAQPGYSSDGKVAQVAAGHDLLDYRI